jgi:predicted dinucleotide-binding enzyme
VRFARAAPLGQKTKTGIVGSGMVGRTLGGVWVRAGHEVMFSSLDIEHDKALAARLGPNARAGTPREAAAFGEMVMISVPYRALPEVGKSLADLIKGKVVIDTCNPFVSPGARLVRAFNAIGASRMGEAHREPGRIGMPIAADDAGAIEIASRLIRDIGYEPVPVGGLAMGKYLMPGTPLAGEHSSAEIRRIAATLKG